jgi:hypothetical protein
VYVGSYIGKVLRSTKGLEHEARMAFGIPGKLDFDMLIHRYIIKYSAFDRVKDGSRVLVWSVSLSRARI